MFLILIFQAHKKNNLILETKTNGHFKIEEVYISRDIN